MKGTFSLNPIHVGEKIHFYKLAKDPELSFPVMNVPTEVEESLRTGWRTFDNWLKRKGGKRLIPSRNSLVPTHVLTLPPPKGGGFLRSPQTDS